MTDFYSLQIIEAPNEVVGKCTHQMILSNDKAVVDLCKSKTTDAACNAETTKCEIAQTWKVRQLKWDCEANNRLKSIDGPITLQKCD